MDLAFTQNYTLSVVEIQAVENAFIRTYNTFSFGLCDHYFRTILHAQLDIHTINFYTFQSHDLVAASQQTDLPLFSSGWMVSVRCFLERSAAIPSWEKRRRQLADQST